MWSKYLIYKLLCSIVDESLVKDNYPLPNVDNAGITVYHHCGMVKRDGNMVVVTDKHLCLDQVTILRAGRKAELNHVFEASSGDTASTVIVIDEKILHMVSIAGTDLERFLLLREYTDLRSDRQRAVREFMCDSKIRTSLICFLSYMASVKLLNDYINVELLCERFNSYFASKRNLAYIDFLQVEALLDLIGSELLLDNNSASPYTMTWLNFLSTFSITRPRCCSIWDEACNHPAEILVNIPVKIVIPIQWYTTISSDGEITDLINGLLKYGKRSKKQKKANQLLLRILWYKPTLTKREQNKVLKRLFSDDIPGYLIDSLAFLPLSPTWETCCQYIEKVHGKEYAQTVQTIVTMERERINRSLGIGGDKNGKTGTR